MSKATIDVPLKGGFSFDLCERNEMLSKKGWSHPWSISRATKGPIVTDKNCEKIHFMAPNIYYCGAGTAADTEAMTGWSHPWSISRATEGPIVADKNCEKIHFMAPNIYYCGVGTAVDTEAMTDMVSSQMQLHRYHTGQESGVVMALTLLKSHLFSHHGYVQAALVLGGVDVTGPHLHTTYGI